jgi:UDP-3-O-[3-hydroxymyristoyl] N-acetylglucosamine deacetylase
VTCARFKPGPANSGIIFNRAIPARLANAFVEQHLVGLRHGGDSVLGVEHLLAACYGLGIDNLQIDVTGGEVPFGDGSALPFIRILQAAGIRRLNAPRALQSVLAPVVVSRADAFICALPADRHPATGDCFLSVNCLIRFPSEAVGEQALDLNLGTTDFARELGPARTFGYWSEGVRLPGWLGRVGEIRDGMLVPARPRFTDEPVRHKALDLLGDLCLLGRRLHARLFAFKTGHVLHHELLRELEDKWT